MCTETLDLGLNVVSKTNIVLFFVIDIFNFFFFFNFKVIFSRYVLLLNLFNQMIVTSRNFATMILYIRKDF